MLNVCSVTPSANTSSGNDCDSLAASTADSATNDDLSSSPTESSFLQ